MLLGGEDDEYRFFKRLVNSDLDELVAVATGAGAGTAVMFISASPTFPSSASLSESDPIRMSSIPILIILCLFQAAIRVSMKVVVFARGQECYAALRHRMVHGDGGILLQTREEMIIKPPAGAFVSTLTRGPFSESRENNFFLVSHKWSQKGPYFFLVSHISFSFRILFRLSCLLSLITSILPSVGLFKKAHENCCPPYTTRARLHHTTYASVAGNIALLPIVQIH